MSLPNTNHCWLKQFVEQILHISVFVYFHVVTNHCWLKRFVEQILHISVFVYFHVVTNHCWLKRFVEQILHISVFVYFHVVTNHCWLKRFVEQILPTIFRKTVVYFRNTCVVAVEEASSSIKPQRTLSDKVLKRFKVSSSIEQWGYIFVMFCGLYLFRW